MRGGAAIAWQAYLVNLLFFLGVAQGALVASAAFYLTQAKWGGSTPYRLGEAFAPFLWVGFFLFFGLYFGRSLIFPWVTHPIAQKAAWLNVPFLFARDGIGLGVHRRRELRIHSCFAQATMHARGPSRPTTSHCHRIQSGCSLRWSRCCSPSSTR